MKYRPVEVTGQVNAGGYVIPRISTRWRLRDHLGALAVRLDISRMNYAVAPGLYAAGEPGKDSPVLACANYKLSFDVLRRQLSGLNVWVLVIDTKGVNVWCAAGKGTFGTMEIVRKVISVDLAKIVTTRQLILPQLGAPGVSAQLVEMFCGFSVKYGPVRAADIKKYLDSGMNADAAMRRVTFGAGERLEVAWLEFAGAAVKGIILSLALFLIMGWPGSALFLGVFWAAIFSGTLLTAVLLPYIPGKAFSLKGGLIGAAVAAVIVHPFQLSLVTFSSAIAAFLALNYTGCSTFTSLSGVKKEIRFALPVIIGMAALSGVLFWRRI